MDRDVDFVDNVEKFWIKKLFVTNTSGTGAKTGHLWKKESKFYVNKWKELYEENSFTQLCG